MDWEKYAAVAGKPLPFLVFGTSILGFILQRYLGIQVSCRSPSSVRHASVVTVLSGPACLGVGQVYVFFISFLVALLEVPWLFYCIGPAKRARDHLVEDFGLGKGWVRGILYIVLSILCYVSTTPSIALLAGELPLYP